MSKFDYLSFYDMNNYLEKMKVEQALRSEDMKMEFRKLHEPDDISILDYTVIAALAKQLPQKANLSIDEGIVPTCEDYEARYFLECPICKSCVGELCDEDADGELKYNMYGKFCSECGQAIEQTYTEDDYKRWGIEV